MFLHEERVRPRWMHRDAMNTVADFRNGIRHVLRMQTAIDRLPRLTAVVGPERACSRNSDENSLSIFRIEKNGVQTHAACARLPFRAGVMFAQTRQLRQDFPPSFDSNSAASSTPA